MMGKMRMESLNLTSQNVEKIEALFPNCITESRDENGKLKKSVNFKMLKQILSEDIVDGEEAYEFTWVGKKESIVEANKPIRKTLRPVPEESVDWENTENLYIEGDNLEVLKLLQESYLGKVKMIYIDPPYNTGNDFIYNDDFKVSNEEYAEESGEIDEEGNRMFKNTDSNGRFHSDWCSMMYSRLLVAKNLLKEDGVIFISIDDNEVENLKKICNEVFGSENFISQIAWRRTDNQPNIGNIATVKEYILCYAKVYKNIQLGRIELSEKARKEYRYSDEKGLFRRGILLHKTRGRHYYDVTTKTGNILSGPWMKTEKDFKKLDEEGMIYWTSGGDEQPYSKIYLDESKGQIPNDFWGIEFGTNQRASLELEKIFGDRLFDFSKSVLLLSNLLKIGIGKDDVVLDFFSGSGTTAHATMALNAEDGGSRKFIMVQLPEDTDEKSVAFKSGYKNICEIGKERIRRAGDKIKSENLLLTSNLDTGFRVLKVDSSNMKDVYYSPSEISQDFLSSLESNIKEDRTDLDLLFGCLLEWGLPLSLSYKSFEIDGCVVHDYNDGDLIACFEENISENVMKEIAKLTPLRAVFRDSSFGNSAEKINTSEIFKLLSPDTKIKVI
ncbi:site-specific DNA-methyltransferase [uncultured Gemella sp.]|uniref:site-specific DNA-methyltransferase n=1 Tax=uncultured Gemella sp. TaxID=254352 RepID=UPI0028E6AC54|nr:site-specific DNA-methyltransferase [uncultured Gemella sp.]